MNGPRSRLWYPDDFFAEAVAWMVDEGITAGVTPTSFAPHRPVTRAKIATFLYRLAGDHPVNVGPDDVSPIADDERLLAAVEAPSLPLLNELCASLGLDPLVRIARISPGRAVVRRALRPPRSECMISGSAAKITTTPRFSKALTKSVSGSGRVTTTGTPPTFFVRRPGPVVRVS